MSYHFVFREIIDHDDRQIGPGFIPYDELIKLLNPYQVPDYLTEESSKGYGWSTVFKYRSKKYDTVEQAMSDFHDVVMDSGIDSTPAFYHNYTFMGNSTEMYKNYISARGT